MELPLKIQGAPIDFELCELLGDKPADFLVLTIDGEQVPFAGTPWDSPHAREVQRRFVDGLNDRSKKSFWPEYFANWRSQFCAEYKLPPETTVADYHPTFDFAISRVCVGYSTHLNAAIGLFEKLRDRVKGWTLQQAPDGAQSVYLTSAAGAGYFENEGSMALMISRAVVRLLRDGDNNKVTDAADDPKRADGR